MSDKPRPIREMWRPSASGKRYEKFLEEFDPPQKETPVENFPHIFSLERKLKAIERELAMRTRVYPKWVRDGNMRQKTADEEIAVMEAIAEDYRKAIEAGKLL